MLRTPIWGLSAKGNGHRNTAMPVLCRCTRADCGAPVTSWKGRVAISCPAAATPMTTLWPQPLWQHSSAARITCTQKGARLQHEDCYPFKLLQVPASPLHAIWLPHTSAADEQ